MVHQILNDPSSIHNPHLVKASSQNQTPTQPELTNEMKAALSAIQGLNLTIEICGSWLWIFGAAPSVSAKIQEANFKCSYKKGAWYLPPSQSSRRFHRQPWAMEKIREQYGSQAVQL